ncbi:ribosome-binding protein 1 [Elysia marginata]|uniref:Ribosome-binding protein 1 n=1 Tax=Elysia marginata TaxID=1093978 RepID=A0AAV4F649_9GAST|nr:ribosome-binding protein 1 [Elysia marginata]
MEVATILIGVAVFIISALMIYCISVVSMREKTFEEVMAEQKEREEKEREKAKAEKKAEKDLSKKKTFKKGKQEKVKEKSAQVTEPEFKSEHKMVNLEIEPDIIEPVEASSLGAGLRQRSSKKDKMKPILVNKDEPPLIAVKQVELYHKPVVPKDEMELKKSHEKIAEKTLVSEPVMVKETKGKVSAELKENLPPKSIEVKEDIKSKHRDDVRSSPKVKKSQGDIPLNGSRLVSVVKTAKLSDDEIQNLIDILLNRQGLTPSPMAPESWNKKSQKGDPISTLKKQLEEKEKLLQEERNNSVGLMSRAKEMKNELTAEKSKTMSIEKRFQEQLLHQQAEVDALKARMQHTHEQHLMETNNLQTRLHQAEKGGDRAVAQKLSEENKILQEALQSKDKARDEKIKQLERDLSSSLIKVQASEDAKKGLEAKIRQLETKQKDDVSVIQRVEEMAHELRKSESVNASLTAELQNANGALGTTKKEVTSLKAKLQELESHLTKVDAKGSELKLQESERKCSDLEKNIKNLEKQMSDMHQRLDGTTNELSCLKLENKNLTDANKIMQEKLQNAPPAPSNGSIHETNMPLEEHERILSEKAKELESQKKMIGNLEVQMQDLQTQLSSQKTKNNELREKNWKAMEALELSEKNWSEKEKALKQARDLGTSAAEIEKHDKIVFQGLFPTVKVSEKLPHKEWVTAFQKQAEKNLLSYATPEKVQQLEEKNKKAANSIKTYEKQLSDLTDSAQYAKLEAENKTLQSEVDHYHNIVSDTERKLRQLEKSIDEEEKKWHEKLRQAKSEGQKGTESVQKVRELETLVSQKEKQIQEYKHVLMSTDSKLKELEGTIGAEEKSWREKMAAAEKELAETKNQLATLKKEITASQGSQEMKLQIEKLEADLRDAQEKITALTKEKEKVLSQLKDTQSGQGDKPDGSQDLNELRTQLDAERKKNKDLSMNVVKLNGIIKTGQDALSQEQGLVKKLQDSLDSKSMSSGISEIEETEQLRAKLVEKQRLLEREMAANKQLSERLVSLTYSTQ